MSLRAALTAILWALLVLTPRALGDITAEGTAVVDVGPALAPIEQRVSALEARVAALENADPDPEPVEPPPPIDPPDNPGVGDKETDLWLNVSHYRYTPVVAYRNGEYVVTDPDFVDLMSKWSGIRYLNWTGQLNRDVNWTWATRVTERHADQWDSTGVPLEAIIAVANATHTHVWWCAPQQADLDYMKQAGRLFARDLDPSLKLYVEIGNENWQSNRGWRYDELAGGDFGLAMQLYAEDSAAKFMALVAGVNGEGFPPDRLVRIMGGQLHNIGVLKSNALKHIDPGDYDAISCSGYFGNSPDTWVNGSGGLNASLRGLQEHAELAGVLNKQLLIYELNQHIDQGTENTEYVDRDPVIQAVKLMIDTAKQRGASVICIYSGAGRRYKNAPWPVYTDHYNPRKIVTELGWPRLEPQSLAFPTEPPMKRAA